METLLSYLAHPRSTGADRVDSNAPQAMVLPWLQALNTVHQTDAHLVCYSLASGNPHPRINKAALPFIRLADDDVVLPFICIDIDNPSHNAWAPGETEAFVNALDALAQLRDIPDTRYLRDYCAFWLTRAGARFLYRLDRFVSCEEWEPMAAGVVDALNRLFRQAGLGQQADSSGTQWNHLFRMPNTMRDGLQTGDQPYFGGDIQPDVLLTADLIQKGIPKSTTSIERPVSITRIPDTLPLEEEARECFEQLDPTTNRVRLTSWGSDAKTALKGRDYFAALFEHAPLAEKGQRDNTLYKCVASVVGLLYGRLGTTPTHIYGLFLGCVNGMAPDAGTPDWRVSVWHKIRHCWQNEEAKAKSEEIQQAEVALQKESTLLGMAKGMGEWYEHPYLQPDPSGLLPYEATEIVGQHLIVMMTNGQDFFVMQPNGRYWPLMIRAPVLIPALRKQLGENIVATQVVNKDGSMRDKTHTELVNMYGTIAAEVTYEAGDVEGGILRNPGTDRAKVVLTPFSRNRNLRPAYSPLVDHWLTLMFGPEQKAMVEKWVAWALAFEEGPICCLSIKGPSGCGKSMFAAGLREVLTTPANSTMDEMSGDWQYNLLKSPFVYVDEGMGSSKLMKAHPADQFRRMIGKAEDTQANRKNMSPVSITVDVRMLMTGNNLSLVRALTANRDLTPEDRMAIMVRLMHVEASQEASLWLMKNGGRKLTQGWVSDGRHSDYVLARHFLFLHSRRHAYGRDSRFLVEGRIDSRVMSELRLHGGTLDRVLEAVVAMAGRAVISKVEGGAKIQGGKLYVVAQDVLKFVRDDLALKGTRIHEIREALLSIVKPNATSLDDSNPAIKLGNDRRDWYPIDVDFITQAADQYGWKIDHVIAAIERSETEVHAPSMLFVEAEAKRADSYQMPLPRDAGLSKLNFAGAFADIKKKGV